MMDYEAGLEKAIDQYKKSEYYRWGAAFAILDLWREFPDRHSEIMAVLVNELHVTDDQVYNLLHAAELASELSRNRDDMILSPSHFSRLHRAAQKYDLPQETVIEYLELATSEGLSAQAMVEEVMRNHDPDEQYLFHRAVRVLIRACRRLLELAESNGIDKRVQDAAKMLVEMLGDAG